MLMFGREIELPIDFIYGPHPQRDEFPNETETANGSKGTNPNVGCTTESA